MRDRPGLRRISVVVLVGASMMLIICELGIAPRLVNARDPFVFYALPFVLAIPVVIGLITRRSLAKWVAGGEMSPGVATQVGFVTNILVFVAYSLYLIAK